MVAAVVRFRQRALRVNRTPELASPDHQRVVEHAALLQILDQRRRRLVSLLALRPDFLGRLLCWSQPRWNS